MYLVVGTIFKFSMYVGSMMKVLPTLKSISFKSLPKRGNLLATYKIFLYVIFVKKLSGFKEVS